MKRTLTLLAAALVAGQLTAQKPETPLLRIGNDVFSLEEFNAGYEKNSRISQVKMSRQEYFNLFLRYKLKVAEAKALGMDTTESYRTESAYYLRELAAPYLEDSAAVAAEYQKIVARTKEEMDVSHIVMLLHPTMTPADTLAVYQKMQNIKAQLDAGANINELAAATSDDPQAATDSGRIVNISALQMIEKFEDQMYATPVGRHSDIFRTRVGYHILRVDARRPFSGERRVAHIMRPLPADSSAAKAAEAKQSIDSVYNALINGADFATLARAVSTDRNSGEQGGEMPWFGRRNIIPEFANQAFALASIGDVSKPFLTKFGWHVIKLIDTRAHLTDEKISEMISDASVNGHSFARASRSAKAKQLLATYDFRWNAAARDTMASILGSGAKDEEKQQRLSEIHEPVAIYKGNAFFVNTRTPHSLNWNRRETPDDNLQRIAEEEILRHETTLLPLKNPAFRYMLQEYYDGLLIFEINQKTVWNTSAVDSLDVERQYKANPARYARGGKFTGSIAFFDEPLSEKEVASHSKKLLGKATHVETGTWERGSAFDEYIWPLVPSRYVVPIGKTEKGKTLPLSEVRSRVISDCQQLKENKWVEELQKKFKPEILMEIK